MARILCIVMASLLLLSAGSAAWAQEGYVSGRIVKLRKHASDYNQPWTGVTNFKLDNVSTFGNCGTNEGYVYIVVSPGESEMVSFLLAAYNSNKAVTVYLDDTVTLGSTSYCRARLVSLQEGYCY